MRNRQSSCVGGDAGERLDPIGAKERIESWTDLER